MHRGRSTGRVAAIVAVGLLTLVGACASEASDVPSTSGPGPSRPSTTIGAGGAVLIDPISTTVMPGDQVTPTTEGSPPIDPVRDLYVSLGDSYAQGYQPSVDGPADYRQGYSYLVPAQAAAQGYDLALVNLGCAGATLESLADSVGCPVPARAPGGPIYEGESQLEAAIDLLERERHRVALVTLSIGGNEITACARATDPMPCVTAAAERIDTELAEILPRLRAAVGPDTRIVGLTYPDVILGVMVRDDPGARSLAELSLTAFRDLINPTLRRRYEAVGATFVDVTAATGAYTPFEQTTVVEPYGEIPVAVARVCELTWFCESQDIHPRDAGHELIADLIVETLSPR